MASDLSARDLAVLALPAMTGLNGLIWAEVVERSGALLATACGVIGYVIVIFSATAAGVTAPQIGVTGWLWLVALSVLNAITATLWLYPITGGTRYVSLALIEGAWPVFSIFFGWVLFGRRELDAVSAAGGVLILAGAALVFRKA